MPSRRLRSRQPCGRKAYARARRFARRLCTVECGDAETWRYEMTDIVLVPGGWRGGWTFSSIARDIRARGHEAWTPTLTGLGERVHLAHRSVNLDTHIDDIANVLLYEQLTQVILCGHS